MRPWLTSEMYSIKPGVFWAGNKTERQPVDVLVVKKSVTAVLRERTVRGWDVKEMRAILNVKISVYNQRILVLKYGYTCLYRSLFCSTTLCKFQSGLRRLDPSKDRPKEVKVITASWP